MACPSLNSEQAAAALRAGNVIAYPTEAVYGLGCDPFNHDAVQRLLDLKARPESAGLILIADQFSRFSELVGEIDSERLAEAEATWPGPVTWLFPKSPLVPGWVSGAHETLAIRVTAHPECQKLCAAFGGAVVSTSANLSGQEPARDRQSIEQSFGALIDGIVEGELGGLERPSEIRDARTGNVVRSG